MKKIIVLLTLSIALFPTCKKKNSSKSTSQQVHCLWIKNSNGTKSFYKCCSTTQEVEQAAIAIRNDNKFYEEELKSSCSDCQ